MELPASVDDSLSVLLSLLPSLDELSLDGLLSLDELASVLPPSVLSVLSVDELSPVVSNVWNFNEL